jgi:hypothetical protein
VNIDEGVNQLANFGAVLSSTLGAFSKNFTRLEESTNKNDEVLSAFGFKFLSQQKIVENLENDIDEVKIEVNEVLRKLQLLELEVSSRIDDTNDHMHKEIMVQRTTAKIELNNMKQAIHSSMNETLELFAKMQGDLSREPFRASKGVADSEIVSQLVDRLMKIENALSVQMKFNEQMTKAVESDGALQLHSFDTVNQQVVALEASLRQTRSENYHMKVSVEDLKTQLARNLRSQGRSSSRPGSSQVLASFEGSSSDLNALIIPPRSASRLPSILASTDADDRRPSQVLTVMNALEDTHTDATSTTTTAMPEGNENYREGDRIREVVHVADEQMLERLNGLEAALNDHVEKTQTSQTAHANRLSSLEDKLDVSSDDTASGLKEMSDRIGELQDLVQTFSGSSVAIKRLQLSMNDVLAELDEIKFRQISDGSDDADALDGRGGGVFLDASAAASQSLAKQLVAVKQQWRDFREELDGGLDYFADIHGADPEGSEAFESVFIQKLAAFADHLDSVLYAFDQQPGKTPEATLDGLFQPLDALTVEVEVLIDLDRQGRLNMGITFDDVTNSKSSTKAIRDELRKVFDASLPLLDMKVDKITMRRRLARLEQGLPQKADKAAVNAVELELKRLLSAKADQHDFVKVASKKVSLGELAQFKDQIMKQIVALRGYEYERAPISADIAVRPGLSANNSTSSADGGPGLDGPSLKPPSAGGLRPVGAAGEGGFSPQMAYDGSSSDWERQLNKLSRRFDILHRYHQDLSTQCSSFVPRQEVEQALQALLAEMRVMKNNSITPDLLKETLKNKASVSEVQRSVRMNFFTANY